MIIPCIVQRIGLFADPKIGSGGVGSVRGCLRRGHWVLPSALIVGMVAMVGFSGAGLGLETWDRDFEVTGVEEPALASFDTTVMSFMQSHDITGGALAVTKDGRVLLERGYTYRPTEDDITVQPNSLFRIGSISKPITAVAVLRLVEQGRLDLSDRVLDVLDLKARPGDVADPRLRDITIRHLLEHLGGWDRDETFDPMFRDREIARILNKDLPISQQDIITYMNGQELQHDPGTTYAYSNYGYLLLGRVIERVTGVDYETFVVDEVLAPLGVNEMQLGGNLEESRLPNEVAYHVEGRWQSVFSENARVKPAYGGWNQENLDAHGGWVGSVGDLARFASSFDMPESHAVLDQPSIERMFALPQNTDPGDYRPGSEYYALGWFVRDYGGGQLNTWHVGSLPGTFGLMVRVRDGVGWVVLFNRRGDEFGPIDGLLHHAAARVEEWPGG